MYSVISALPSSSGGFHRSVKEVSVAAIDSGVLGGDGRSNRANNRNQNMVSGK